MSRANTSPLDRHRMSLEYCTYCPKLCRHACPVSNAEPREAIIPQQKMQTANLLRKGQLNWTNENTEVLYACTGCRACTEVCAHNIEPGRVLLEARAEASRHAASSPRLDHLPGRFSARAKRLSRKLSELTLRPGGVGLTQEAASPRAFHPACSQLESYPDDFVATARLLGRRDPRLRLVQANAICAGYPLFAGGKLEPWLANARLFAQAIAQHEEVVSGCAACVHLLGTAYPQYGVQVRPKITHVTELLESLEASEPGDTGPPGEPAVSTAEANRQGTRPRVLYHDACHLGRGLGRYEGPRSLLRARADVDEFSRNRQAAECSGGGGLVPTTMPSAARQMALRRLETLPPGDARPIVTSCATCKRQFENARPDLEIVDLVAWLSRSEQGPP